MVKFDLEKFFSGMNDVDKDLREMALFDLHQALKDPGLQLTESEVDRVVDHVLRCFTKNELDKEVRNNAIQVAPQLFLFCSERQQIRFSSFLCTSATFRGMEFGDRGSSEIVESSTFALGLCCESMAERAQVNIEAWQRLTPVAHSINATLLSKLGDGNGDIAKDGFYGAIIALIVPFARTFSSETREEMAKRALMDFSGTGSACRRAIACLSLLSPFLSENAFNDVRETALLGLQGKDPNLRLLPHLLLYEALVKNSPLRMMTDICTVINILLMEIRRRTNEYTSEDDDVCDTIMRVVNSMVCQYPNELSTSHGDIFSCCVTLMRFDPNYCGDPEEEEAGIEEEGNDTYEDYYMELEEVDTSWKLRMWAAKLLSSLIQISPFSDVLIQRLNKADIFSVSDRMEEVQLANLQLLNAIAQHPRFEEAHFIVLNLLNSLLRCVSGFNQKVSVMAIKTLQLFFHLYGENLMKKGDAICHVLSDLVAKETNETNLLNSEVITLSQYVMDAALTEPRNISIAMKLFDTVFYTICKSRFDKVSDRALRVMQTMTCVALSVDDSYTERCVSLLFSLLERKTTEMEVSRAATEAMGECLSRLFLTLSEDTLRHYLHRLVSLTETNVNALHVLGSALGRSTAIQIPPDLLVHISAYLAKCNYSHQYVVIGVLKDALKNGSELPKEALDVVIKFIQVNALRSKEAFLIRRVFELLTEVCNKYPSVIEQTLEMMLSSVWNALETLLASASSFYGQVVEDAASFLHTLCLQFPQQRFTLTEAVLKHILISTSPDLCSELLSGVIVDDGETIGKISSFFFDNPGLTCLCVGTVGRSQPLPEEWKNFLLENFAGASSESTRSLGMAAIGRAASNPKNTSLFMQIVERAVTETKDRSLYWRLIKEVMHIAASQEPSPFGDHLFRKHLMERLLEGALEDDVETTAAVLGSFVSFDVADLLDITCRYLNSDSEIIKATCISIQRYLISHCKGEEIQPQLASVIETSLQNLGRNSSVRIRLAALQLFSVVASSQPHLLFTPTMRDVVYPNVLAELVEDPSLVLTVNLGGYTHREDKGIEIRRLAFEIISILLRDTERQRRGKVLEFFLRLEELLQCLVHACGPQEKGEVDVDLNNQAKTLLVQLVNTRLKLPWSDSLITSLHGKLKAVLELKCEGKSLSAEKERVNIRYTLNCVMRLTECVPFAYIPQFQPLLLLAQKSSLLAESMKLVL
ncbi:hypothetical protein MOQ_006368 [Trypanosoma cruzi marinkellei]|uniref:TATA-binding protein interacting (TIP20) domain-containing protein n=1 Tax=Trypanosoma cruzi marinkellei TaxID=85056 RepID=K2M4D3_TRYCR|nr:hypothetical protein MOQ_006368 [Trypanosoma cruzi marinkellei]